MDYPSFFKRDYNLAPLDPGLTRRRLRHWHWVSALLLVLALVGLIGATPEKAGAIRDRLEPVEPALKAPLQEEARRTVPLPLPGQIRRDPVPAPGGRAASEAEAAAKKDEAQWRRVTVGRGDSLAGIFDRLDLERATLHRILELGGDTGLLRRIHPGDTLRLQIDPEGQLQEMVYELDGLRRLVVARRGEEGFQHQLVEREPEVRLTYAAGTIEHSLFTAAREAGLSTRLTMDLATIFGWDIDFALDIRRGDQFAVLYEEHYLDGEKLRDGKILAAEFINQGRAVQAIYFEDGRGKTDYYTPDGHNMRKEFLRTPVEFTRISSRFSRGRRHPILNRIRAHKGVDYAAPTGTPVKATGDGKVVHVGRKGGYGKVVMIQHGTRHTTVYAHLSRYARGTRHGRHVRQGQTIAYVGSTGLATGPHLHYEFRVNGVHRNPLRVKLAPARPLAERYRAEFEPLAERRLAQLETIKRTQLALKDER